MKKKSKARILVLFCGHKKSKTFKALLGNLEATLL